MTDSLSSMIYACKYCGNPNGALSISRLHKECKEPYKRMLRMQKYERQFPVQQVQPLISEDKKWWWNGREWVLFK